MSVKKAVIPAAGFGTRMLPATKAVPKELLPILDRPTLQYVVEEAAAAGVDDVLLVTSRDKRALEDHFDRNPELEQRLAASGKESLLASLATLAARVKVHSVRQPSQRGLGDAVSQARRHVCGEPFLCLLGDAVFSPAALPAFGPASDAVTAAAPPPLRGRPIGQVLAALGKVTRAQVDAALDHQKRHGGKLGEVLVQLGYASRLDIDAALAAQRGEEPAARPGETAGARVAHGSSGGPLPAQQLVDAYREFGTCVIGLEEVPAEKVSRYGIVGGRTLRDGVLRLDTLVEKPSPEAAPSRLAIAARYVLTPAVFDCIDATQPGKGGEIQLTDALKLLLAREPIHGVVLNSTRHDIGNPVDWLKTNLIFASRDETTWRALRPLIESLLGGTA